MVCVDGCPSREGGQPIQNPLTAALESVCTSPPFNVRVSFGLNWHSHLQIATIPDYTMTKRKWLRAILIGGVLLFAASFGFSRALRASAARRYLIAHLAASFGRPVDVSWFDFSLLDGARIEAHFVSVSDDPHFGNEYFLRADTLTAGPAMDGLARRTL